MSLCNEGFSLSVWLKIPAVPVEGLILVLQGSASIGIYQNKYNVQREFLTYFILSRTNCYGPMTEVNAKQFSEKYGFTFNIECKF